MLRRPSMDNSFYRLRRAGWTAGDVAFHGPDGHLVWFVSAYKPPDWLSAGGLSQEEAWDEAAQHAEAIDWQVDTDRSGPSHAVGRNVVPDSR